MSRGFRTMTRAVAVTDLLTVGQAPALALGQQYLAASQAGALLFANMVGDQQRGFLAGSAALRRVLRQSPRQPPRGPGGPARPAPAPGPDGGGGPSLYAAPGPVAPPQPTALAEPVGEEPDGDLEARLAELQGLTSELYEEVPRGFRKVRRDVRHLGQNLALYGRPVVT